MLFCTLCIFLLILSLFYNTVETTNFDLDTDNDDDELFKTMEKLSIIFEPLRNCNSLDAIIICQIFGHFLTDFFPSQDILNKCIGEFLSKQQNHYKYLIEILFIVSICSKFSYSNHSISLAKIIRFTVDYR